MIFRHEYVPKNAVLHTSWLMNAFGLWHEYEARVKLYNLISRKLHLVGLKLIDTCQTFPLVTCQKFSLHHTTKEKDGGVAQQQKSLWVSCVRVVFFPHERRRRTEMCLFFVHSVFIVDATPQHPQSWSLALHQSRELLSWRHSFSYYHS